MATPDARTAASSSTAAARTRSSLARLLLFLLLLAVSIFRSGTEAAVAASASAAAFAPSPSFSGAKVGAGRDPSSSSSPVAGAFVVGALPRDGGRERRRRRCALWARRRAGRDGSHPGDEGSGEEIARGTASPSDGDRRRRRSRNDNPRASSLAAGTIAFVLSTVLAWSNLPSPPFDDFGGNAALAAVPPSEIVEGGAFSGDDFDGRTPPPNALIVDPNEVRSLLTDPYQLRKMLGDDDEGTRKLAESAVRKLGDRYSFVERAEKRGDGGKSGRGKGEDASEAATGGRAVEGGGRADGKERKTTKEGNGRGKEYLADPFDVMGLGLTLFRDPETKLVTVSSPPRPGSPADRAGIKLGDVVRKVDDVKITSGVSPFDVADSIFYGGRDDVRMTIVDSSDGTKERTVVMERDFAGVSNPVGYKLSEVRSDGTNVGYVKLTKFNAISSSKLKVALETLEQQGANAYVLDLRGNTGGVFQAAIGAAGSFLDDRIAVKVVDSTTTATQGVDGVPPVGSSTKEDDGGRVVRTPKGRVAIDPSHPVAIWIDGRTASAAEVFASALRDNCRAAIMGDKSFGKGIIQAAVGLEDGGKLVVTVGKYVTPSGNDIEGVGIRPDFDNHDDGSEGGSSSKMVPSNFPGKMTDTSKVDFGKVTERLESICRTR